jgi:protein-S-isoprenylcysteine O-methyltransferase Ste14
MYTTLFLMGLGWFLLTANWLIGPPLMIGIIVVIWARVANEETVMTQLFGDEYLDYMEQTGRFLPSFFLKN